jgi:hypothetical protein
MMRVSPLSIVQQSWIVEHHLLLVTMPEMLTSDTLQDCDAELYQLLNSSSSSFLHLLIDARSLRVYPSLSDFMSLKSLNHANLGWFLTVGVNKQPLLRFLLTNVMNSARVRYLDFDTMDEAYAFARTIDTALSNLLKGN